MRPPTCVTKVFRSSADGLHDREAREYINDVLTARPFLAAFQHTAVQIHPGHSRPEGRDALTLGSGTAAPLRGQQPLRLGPQGVTA